MMLPVGKKGVSISMMDLAYITVKDFEIIAGSKLNLIGKVGFKLGQRKLRRGIAPDGQIKNKAIERYASKIIEDEQTGFHIGGFALGFYLGPIGVLIAYLIKDDKKKNRAKWAWIGFVSTFVVTALFVVLILTTLFK